MARAGYLCEAKLTGCLSTPQETPHHRKKRTQGGTNGMNNLLAVCWRCHTRIHSVLPSDPDRWAYKAGLLLRRSDPEEPFTSSDN